MEANRITKLARFHPVWAPALTFVSIAVVVSAALSGSALLAAFVGVTVPLSLIAALRTTAVTPLAQEVLRLRGEVERLSADATRA
jgi:uncharacterized membrane protein YfbV (UPF0208 family)